MTDVVALYWQRMKTSGLGFVVLSQPTLRTQEQSVLEFEEVVVPLTEAYPCRLVSVLCQA